VKEYQIRKRFKNKSGFWYSLDMVDIILLISLIGIWIGAICSLDWLTFSALLLNSIVFLISMVAGKDKK